jgi:hypothetical protein
MAIRDNAPPGAAFYRHHDFVAIGTLWSLSAIADAETARHFLIRFPMPT